MIPIKRDRDLERREELRTYVARELTVKDDYSAEDRW